MSWSPLEATNPFVGIHFKRRVAMGHYSATIRRRGKGRVTWDDGRMKKIAYTFIAYTFIVLLSAVAPLRAHPQPTAPAKLTKKARKICQKSGRNPKSLKLLKWPMVDGWQGLCRPHKVTGPRPIYIRCKKDSCWIPMRG